MSETLGQSISSLSSSALLQLSGDLTTNSVTLRNWTGVAGNVGFTFDQIDKIRSHNDSCKGMLLLNTWEGTGQSSIKKLLFALFKLEMMPLVELIEKDCNLSEAEITELRAEFTDCVKSKKCSTEAIPKDVFYEVLYRRNNPFAQQPSMPSPQLTCQEDRLSMQCPSPDCTTVPYSVEPNSVFISYFHEMTEIKTRSAIKKLAETLSKYGFKVKFGPSSQVEIRNTGGITRWKERCIQTCQDIIVVCTPNYFKEDLKCSSSESTKPSKIAVDSELLRGLVYGSEKRKIIPVLLDSSSKSTTDCVPLFLQSLQYHYWPSKEEDLLYCLQRVPKYVLPKPKKFLVIKPKVIPLPKDKRRRQLT